MNILKRKRFGALLLILVQCVSFQVFAELVTYTGVTNSYSKQSTRYSVKIAQNGVWKNSFVYQSDSTWFEIEPEVNGEAASTSYTSFSFDGIVTVEVTKLVRNASSVIVRPSRHNIVPVFTESKIATFTIDKPGQYSVEFDDVDAAFHPVFHGLMIFANPLENPTEVAEVPPGSQWHYGPGFHNIGINKTVPSGTKIYIAGGAVVRGSFHSPGNDNIKIFGRGIITGAGIPRADDSTLPFDDSLFPENNPPISSITNKHSYNLLNFDVSSENIIVDGLTFVDLPHFAIILRGNTHTVNNVKTIGWYRSTDGVGTGTNSSITNSFFKGSDDLIKLYHSNTTVDNCVLWNAYGGAAFQFSWGGNGTKSNFDVSNCDVIHFQIASSGNWSAGDNMSAGNKHVFSSMHTGNANYSDYNFTNIRVEESIMRLIGIYNDGSGSIKNVRFKNLFVDGPVQRRNFLDSKTLGKVKNFTFENLYINDKRIKKSNGNPKSEILKLDLDKVNNSTISYPASPFNRIPGIAQITDVQFDVNQITTIIPDFWDDDGDILTFSSPNLPSFGSINSNTGVITLAPDDSDAGDYFAIKLIANDGNGGTFTVYFNAIIQNLTPIAPTLSETTPVSDPTNDTTPSYTFNTDKAGTITYGGSCSSATTVAVIGDNTIDFNALAEGTYTDCTIIVTDAASNASTPLAVSSFTIDTTNPVITISAPTKTATQAITDTIIQVTDDTAVTAANVSVEGATTATTSNLVCTQTNPTTVDCTISIDSTGDLTIAATDDASNAGVAVETGYVINTPVAVSIDDVSVNEGDGTASVTVSLSALSASTVTVVYQTQDGSATDGPDYSGSSGTLTFSGVTSQTITIPIIQDTDDEGTESFDLHLSNAVNASIVDDTGVVSIIDDDTAIDTTDPVITISAPTKTATQAITDTTIQVTDDTAVTAANVSVEGATTATTSNLVCTQTNPTTVDCTISIDSTGDLTIAATDDASNTGVAVETGYVINTPVSVSIDDVSVNEGDGTASVTVSLSALSASTVTVVYQTQDGSATDGPDYSGSSGTLTFSGVTSQTITIPIIQDTDDEGTESFDLHLSNPVNASIADDTGVVSITDDDTATDTTDPVITISAPTKTATQAITDTTIQVTDDTAVTAANVSVEGATTATTSNLVCTQTNPTTVDCTISIDSTGDLTITATDDASNAGVAVETGYVINTPVFISIDDVSVNEGDGTASVTVSLSALSASTVTVVYQTQDGSATDGPDYSGSSGTLTFSGVTSQTITIPIIQDTDDEGTESFDLHLSNPVNASIVDDTGIISITDDDAPPSGAACGDPNYNRKVDRAIFLWRDCATDNKWHLRVSGGAGPLLSTQGNLITDQSFANVTTFSYETNDVLDTISVPGQMSFQMSAGKKFHDGINFDVASGTTCMTLDAPAGMDVLAGENRMPVRSPFDIETLDSCGAPGQPRLSIADVQVNEAAGTASVTVSLSALSASTVTVVYQTQDGSATAGSDYTNTSGTLTFSAATSQAITIPIIQDTDDEGTESFDLHLSNAVNASIVDDTGVISIIDDDAPPSGAACGDPNYNRRVDRAIFLWRDCATDNEWHLRVSGGAGPLLITQGNLITDQAFNNVTTISYEANDMLDITSIPGQMSFLMRAGKQGRDGINFDVASGTTCMTLDAPAGMDVLAGENRMPVSSPFDIETLGPCL